jgi:uncharacterized protein YidB (DUF937 family)
VIWAAFFNFIAFLFFGLHVAQTIGKGIIAPEIVDDAVIFGALGGAIAWNVATWLAGIPSSSSHALIGGLLGAGMAKAGGAAPVLWPGVLKTIAGIVVSPALGFGLALLLVLIVSWAFVKATPARADGVFRRLQFVSASLFSLGHGGNDAQKLPEVVKQFEEKGMRDEVDSWVRTGPNKPIDRRKIEDVFGDRELNDLARSKGIDPNDLAEVLAKYIPKIIDELTPQGQLQRRG